MMWLIAGVLVIFLVAGFLVFVARMLGPDAPAAPAAGAGDDASIFQRMDWLLSPAERSFFGVLEQAIPAGHRVMCKVRLADLVFLPKGLDASKRTRLRNQVTSKHVDFVIVTVDELRPVAVVELDDASHARASTQKRDAFVNQVLRGAGLGVVRVAAKRGYVVGDVARAVKEGME